MRPDDVPRAATRGVQDRLDRLREALQAAPAWVKALLALAAMALVVLTVIYPLRVADLLVLAAACCGPVALWRGFRSLLGSLGVALWGAVAIVWAASKIELTRVAAHKAGGLLIPAHTVSGAPSPWPLLLLLPLVVAAAHARVLAGRLVPCRTVAWALLWSLPPSLLVWYCLALWSAARPASAPVSWAVAWVLALAVLAWRRAKVWQVSRAEGRQQERAAAGGPPKGGWAGTVGRGSTVGGGQAGQRPVPDRAVRAAESAQGQLATVGMPARGAADPEQPVITIAEAMTELDAMIGLEPVKNQIRQLTASVEAARRRAHAGHQSEKPLQHVVFLGPPGTGKTTVARVIAKIYYAFGLLDRPEVLEAQRSDLVGEYLGATAIKTNELVDAALGGVLFIDEAYSLANDGDGHGDRFGSEAVQALLKRAEDERGNLMIILAGYERQMEDFLGSNPGLSSRFAMRIKFSGYSPAEMSALARAQLGQRGETLGATAGPALDHMMEDVGRRRLTDDLGNGRFVRNLLDKAGQARDVRVMAGSAEPGHTELVTLEAPDLEQAFTELTSRFRGYAEAPTLESALAELDELIGLEPVKRQVHEIAAQLRVARLRDRQGLASAPPARHFVFTGPPGTGKTTVARILGRIFAALGMLVRPEVIEAHRADLVGEHLGSTAIKTGKLVDSALGGVLFIDEAYSLYNPGYTGGDAYGGEAVATLLKRAEDDRDRLVMVLAGYPQDMDRFLRSNPGLSSRFSVRISFPSYTPAELGQIARMIAERAGDSFDPDAMPVLTGIFQRACDEGRIDELGNGRFARSLFERACAARDLRVADLGERASAADLTTVTAADLTAAIGELSPGTAQRQ